MDPDQDTYHSHVLPLKPKRYNLVNNNQIRKLSPYSKLEKVIIARVVESHTALTDTHQHT